MGYATIMRQEALTARMGGFTEHPTEIASLQGRRLAIASEVEANARWATARIKQLSGGDRICARFMRRDPFTFQMQAQVVAFANHRPSFSGGLDSGMARRLRLVPFDRKPKRADEGLADRLAKERAGILNRLIEWACLYYRDGLATPAVIDRESGAYMESSDTLRQFVADWCKVGEGKWTERAKFRTAYNEWREKEGYGKAVSQQAIGASLNDMGHAVTQRGGKRGYAEIELKEGAWE